ncbi:epidermal retinol dehydrogenase 2-like isoform X2 [Ctenocephalides felis]|uniref:epidermal retinol dehydrogenase 2-like isoform X2 n=1 Tax=Ctenocephalides felis TaxID=7515 RepID=UPI000E6E1A79|nr:epidermal retinol dehydrogenase 2-like isoform X2 [Ctenocephalides felis]
MTDNGGGTMQVAAKIFTAISLTLEILLLILRVFYEAGYAIFRKFVPFEERPVVGEIVLITGAGHGIGKEMALQYSALGATVVCLDLNKQNNEQTVNEIKSNMGKAHAYVCDVTNKEQVLEVAKQVQKEVGDVTILINNAGIMPSHAMLDHTTEEIRKIFDINVFAHFHMFEAYLPTMIKKNKGHIVALSSMAGIGGFPNLVPYCGSKFAVRGLMEALHEELREDPRQLKIKLTTVCPYMVDTGLCKVVKIRFPGFMPMVNPKNCASAIIKAQRQGIEEITIPGYLLHLNNFVRLFPIKAGILIKDFFDSGVGSDLHLQ